ncbi:unnamed protein product [Phaeothamnion confervicola]
MSTTQVKAHEVFMPALSSTMTEGKIVQWLKGIGDRIEVGEAVMVVESDKADMDVEAFEAGYLAAIMTGEGEAAPVGATVALIAESEADIAAFSDSSTSFFLFRSGSSSFSPAAAPVAPAPPAAPTKPSVPFGEIFMPALSSTMTEGKVVQWLKNKGDKVAVGDAVLVVESDKADMDVESFDEGYVAAIMTGEGEAAPVGIAIALLATKEEDIPVLEAYAAALKSGGSVTAAVAETPAAADAVSGVAGAKPLAFASATTASGGRVLASGYARKLAQQYGVDIGSVSGSGPNSRVVAADIESAKAKGPAAPAAAGAPATAKPSATAAAAPVWTPAPGVIAATPRARALAKSKGLDLTKIRGTGNFGRVTEDDVKAALGEAPKKAAAAPAAGVVASMREAPELPDGPVKMDGMQNAVAKNMEATLAIPVFRVSRKIRTDAFDELYKQLKPRGVTVSAMLAKAVALVLEKHPVMNARYAPGQTVFQKDINVAMAVSEMSC